MAAAAILIAAAVLYAAMCAYGVIYGRTWIDEITYLVKSWWYVTGAEQPYSDADATWYMPLYFYQLGWAQQIFGQGHITGRVMSAVMGAGGGALVFLICRRLALAAPVAALGTALFLLGPTTAYYFTTATPIATVAILLLLAIYLVQRAPDAPPVMSFGLGVLFAVLYFYRQNMILALAVLAPLYLWQMKRWRLVHGALLMLGFILVAAPILALFPGKLALYAIRLPLITPVLHELGLLPDTLRLIQDATESRYSLSLDVARLSWRDPVNAFILPFLGTNLLALAVFALYRSERFLMLVPAFYFFLAVTHYLGSAGYCPACILTYTSYFIGLGAVAAALTVDALWRKHKALLAPAALGVAALALNALGPALAVNDASGAPSLWKNFPLPLVSKNNGLPDLVVAERLAGIVAMTVPDARRVLVLDDQPQLAYAVARSGRSLPVQGFNLRQSYRRLRADLPEAEKAEVIRVLEAESLWTDATLLAWLDDPAITAVMLQMNAVELPQEARARFAENFRLSANVVVLGRAVGIYLRQPPVAAPVPQSP